MLTSNVENKRCGSSTATLLRPYTSCCRYTSLCRNGPSLAFNRSSLCATAANCFNTWSSTCQYTDNIRYDIGRACSLLRLWDGSIWGRIDDNSGSCLVVRSNSWGCRRRVICYFVGQIGSLVRRYCNDLLFGCYLSSEELLAATKQENDAIGYLQNRNSNFLIRCNCSCCRLLSWCQCKPECRLCFWYFCPCAVFDVRPRKLR